MEFCQWLDAQSVCQTLAFWANWLHSHLEHTPRKHWLDVARQFYQTGDPLATATAVALLLGLLCLVLSLPTNNHSWVDKLWSIVPIYYAWHYALHDKMAHPGVPLSPRLVLMSALVTVWGVRLTWNFARKGGYRFSEEDYRWPYIRARVHPLLFLLFNATFIAFIQHLLLMALTAPAYVAWQHVGTPLNGLDLLAASLTAFFILYEAAADQDQWEFQRAKHAKRAAGKRMTAEEARGFCTSGLFRFSRHPNFWAEQCIWWSVYLFGVAASGRWLNWTVAAPISLTLLFQGSTWLTERISTEKYPQYAEYRATTSRFLPWTPFYPPRPRKRTGMKAPRRSLAAVQEEGEEEQEQAPAPTTAAKQRRGRGRAAAAKAEEVEEAPASPKQRRGRGRAAAAKAAEEEPAPAAARPARSPRKSAKAQQADQEEVPAPTRQSSRLRTRARAV